MAMVTSSLVCADFCKKTAELGGGALAIDFMRANIEKASGVLIQIFSLASKIQRKYNPLPYN